MREPPAGSRDEARTLRGAWWVEAVLLAGLGALTLALANGVFLGLDLALRDWSDAHRPRPAYVVARGFNFLAQGTPLALLALATAVWLAWRLHTLRPLLPVAAAALLIYGAAGPLKVLTHRAPPHARAIAHPEWLFSQPDGASYPSGHAVNAIVWYGVLALLVGGVPGGRWLTALRVALPVVVGVATTYLGFHWLTDMVAGSLLGVVLLRLLYRVPWDALPLGRRLTAAGRAGPAFDR